MFIVVKNVARAISIVNLVRNVREQQGIFSALLLSHKRLSLKRTVYGDVAFWGMYYGNMPHITGKVYNPPESTLKSLDKLEFYYSIKDNALLAPHIFPLTTSFDEAKSWAESYSAPVYCRMLTRSSAGKGIEVARTVDEINPNAKYYTLGVHTHAEFRVHFFVLNNSAAVLQKLALRKESREEREVTLNKDICTHENGWVYGEPNEKLPDDAQELGRSLALEIGKSLGLTYGCADFIYDKEGKLWIVEANSAPAVTGQSSIAFYTNVFKELSNA